MSHLNGCGTQVTPLLVGYLILEILIWNSRINFYGYPSSFANRVTFGVMQGRNSFLKNSQPGYHKQI